MIKFLFNPIFLIFIAGVFILATICLVLKPALWISIVIIGGFIFLYILILILYFLFKKTVQLTIAKKAKGELSVKSGEIKESKSLSMKSYIYKKLSLYRWLPFVIQHRFKRYQLTLIVGQHESIKKTLKKQQWQELDNPDEYPASVFVKNNKIIVCFKPEQEILKILKKYFFLRAKPRIYYAIDADDYLHSNADKKNRINNSIKRFQESQFIRKIKISLLLTDIDKLSGYREIMTDINVQIFFDENMVFFDLENNSWILEHLKNLKNRFINNNDGNIDNAAVQWFVSNFDLLLTGLKKNLINVGSLSIFSEETVKNDMRLFSRMSNRNIVYVFCFRLLTCIVFLLSIVWITLIGLSYIYNHDDMKRINAYLIKFHEMKNEQRRLQISYQIYSVYQPSADTIWQHMGLYQGNKLTVPSKEFLQNNINSKLVPILTIELQNLLDYSIKDRKNVTTALQAYLMLRYPVRFNAETINHWLLNRQKRVENRFLLTPIVQKLIASMKIINFSPIHVKTDLVKSAQNVLPRLNQQIKSILMEEAKASGHVPLSSLLSNKANKLISDADHLFISRFFTAKGYHDSFVKNNNLLTNLTATQWVRSQNIDKKSLEKIIITTYAKLYIQHWNKLINNIEWVKYNNIKQLVDNNSGTFDTIIELKNLVVKNTNITGDKQLSKLLNKRFNEWSYIDDKTLKELKDNYGELANFLDELQKSDDVNKAVFNLFVKANKNNNAIKPYDKFDSILPKLPDGMVNWIKENRQESVETLLITANHYINLDWQQIVPILSNILQKYPFDETSKNDMQPSQFVSLFSSGSELEQFLKTDVSPFINFTTAKMQSYYGARMPWIRSTRNTLITLAEINRSFFTKDDTLSLEFTLRPTYLSQSAARIYLSILNKNVNYSHGPLRSTHLVWPAQLENSSAGLTWVWRNGSRTFVRKQGIWAWSRLLQTAKAESTTQRDVWKLAFFHKNRRFDMRVYATPAVDLLLSGRLNQLTLPQPLS